MQAVIEQGTLRSYDLSFMETFLRVCRSELVLLGDSPMADLRARIVDGALVTSVRLGMRIRGRFVLPRDWIMLVYLQETDGAQSWCHGLPMGPGSCITVLPTGAAEFSLAANSVALLALIPRRFLGEEAASDPFSGSIDRLEPGIRVHAGASAFHDATLRSLSDNTLSGEHLSQWLDMHRQAEPLTSGVPLASLRARRSRYQIFRKAEDFMLANMPRQIYMQEICDAAGTSERTLRYAFDDLTGNSPGRYLSLLRLCAACRALTRADATELSVKSVALSCGLWDLSRFADSYRNVFGELPRDTLQRMTG